MFVHSAFYRFTPVAQPQALAEVLERLAQGVHGAILVAEEGVNGAVSGAAAAVAAFEHALQSAAVLDGALHGMPFKRSRSETEPFGRFKVLVKTEIVALGLPGGGALPAPDEQDATHVSPAAWRDLIARDDVVVLDNRNHFEFRLGHFRGALDPQVHRFSDFVAYVTTHAPAWRAQGKTVAMYCTGGIRCDKTAPWMRQLGLEVKQLQGGILHYLEAMPDAAEDWHGQCFVFDKRLALDASLQETHCTVEEVFDASQPDEAWRLERARRLAQFGA
jgi:UPF0176 protein